jgi:hypothetical protein
MQAVVRLHVGYLLIDTDLAVQCGSWTTSLPGNFTPAQTGIVGICARKLLAESSLCTRPIYAQVDTFRALSLRSFYPSATGLSNNRCFGLSERY